MSTLYSSVLAKSNGPLRKILEKVILFTHFKDIVNPYLEGVLETPQGLHDKKIKAKRVCTQDSQILFSYSHVRLHKKKRNIFCIQTQIRSPTKKKHHYH